MFWQGKKVFLTGHTGFKGSWLSLMLQLLGAEVTGFPLSPPTSPNLFTLAKVAEGMTSIIGDIRDLPLLQQALTTHAPEIVIHMAAQPLVQYAYQHPVETYHTNVLGTVHLLEAIRQVDTIKAVINVTTDKCYENKEWHWGYRENDRLGGHDPYSNSKACAELVTAAYRDSYFHSTSGKGLASARAGNVIGGGDWAANRLIPDMMRGCLQKETIVIRHPHAIRPWQHVLEPLSGYLRLAQRLYEQPLQYAQSWNFGPHEDDVKTVGWIADYLIKHWPSDGSFSPNWTQDTHQHPHEATFLKLDCAKAKAQLGWAPHWDLERGLKEILHWYRAFAAGEDMRKATLAQIKQFMNE